MRKRTIFIIIILILVFIILNFCKSKTNIIDDIVIFGMWDNIGKEDNKTDEYIINPTRNQEITIDLISTIQNGVDIYYEDKIYKKIAPGCNGSFIIKLDNSLNSDYKVLLKELYDKPQNLKFIIDNNSYNTIQEIQNKLNQIFKTRNIAIIQWEWKYDSDKDEEDTQDGENLKEYKITVNVL